MYKDHGVMTMSPLTSPPQAFVRLFFTLIFALLTSKIAQFRDVPCQRCKEWVGNTGVPKVRSRVVILEGSETVLAVAR